MCRLYGTVVLLGTLLLSAPTTVAAGDLFAPPPLFQAPPVELSAYQQPESSDKTTLAAPVAPRELNAPSPSNNQHPAILPLDDESDSPWTAPMSGSYCN